MRDAGRLLLFCGLSSMVSGAIYGSYFGLPALKKFALWHDPLEGDPLGFMSAAIGIGIVLMSLGLVFNVINHFRRGQVLGGILDKFGVAGLLFYWGSLALVLKFAAFQSMGLVKTAIVVFLLIPVLGWTLKEPVEFARKRRARPAPAGGSLSASFMESLVGVFEAMMSYFSNTISFVRLAAYAMSHSALLLAAFMMAEQVRHFPAVGGLLSVLVVVLGNLVAIVLEGIVAAVQALRLEYYEFFSKFFSGGGRPFQPFCLIARAQVHPG
jgi:V/A-type H+/Na+-transporting ATPase subunit I